MAEVAGPQPVGHTTTVPNSTSPIPTRALVVGMVREDGTLPAGELFDVAEAYGLTAEQVRSCLRRLVAEGMLTRDGSGRSATYRSTSGARSELERQLRRSQVARNQDDAGRGWDRRWRLVAFTIPESKRAVRDDLRVWLLRMGAAAIHSGLYVSTHPFLPLVDEEATRLGVGEYLVAAESDELVVGSERDPRRLAASLWPVADLASGYNGFVDAFAALPEDLEKMLSRHERPDEAELLAQMMTVGMRFAEVSLHDPFLPPELLPRPWPGRTARQLMARVHRAGSLLRGDAQRPNLFRVFDEAARHGI